MTLQAENISYRYKPNAPYVLRHTNLSLNAGEWKGLFAPSGSGKSTLGKILAGYIKQTEGTVCIDGKVLPKKGYCPVQMIFQHPEKAVNPLLTMRQNMKDTPQARGDIFDALEIRREWESRFPTELSGGELMRFCIARALGGPAQFLIADEITPMMDPISQAAIWKFLKEECKKRNIGVLVVSHSKALLEKLCTSIVSLRESEGETK